MNTDRINEPQYNAGNFQEYTYELEWIECVWNNTYNCINLVTAFTYPWINLNHQPLYTNQ
jgi:hypothetical protein